MDSKLEQYLLLGKNSGGLAIEDLIKRALSEPGLFAYGELLDLPSIMRMKETEQSKWFNLLRIFAYGTYEDYKDQESNLPPIDEKQTKKLRQLTVISLASQKKVLEYSVLMSKLGIDNVRQLEDLLITECFYADLLKGKLDQEQSCLIVHDTISRDVEKSQVPNIIGKLSGWLENSQSLLGIIQERLEYVHAAAQSLQARNEAAIDKREKNLQAIKVSQTRGSLAEDLPDFMRNPVDMAVDVRPMRPKRNHDYMMF